MGSAQRVTESVATPLPVLIRALKAYRLRQDFTYRKLGQLIGINHSRLFEVLNAKEPRVNDRTKYRIEQFAHSVGILEERRAS